MMEHRVEINLVSRDALKGHEEVIPTNLDKRISKLLDKGFYKPIVVDKSTMVILDGHHKWTAARLLDLDNVPVVMVDYMADESIGVDVWPGCGKGSITKEEVLEMGLSDDNFPPKTSRHILSFELPSIQIPLDELKD